MLNAREPKIVNGPEVLDKYVGESEAKIRALFAEAEAEERSMGPLSGLHIIIFDEIDAICKARGSLAGSSGVNDTVVNQLLSKIDGVEQLNNILVIGMTNRKDMIDEALMRPGRLEVQIGKVLDDPQVQGVPTCLGQAKCNFLKLRSLPAKITNFTKKCILLHKIAFSAFFVNCKKKQWNF